MAIHVGIIPAFGKWSYCDDTRNVMANMDIIKVDSSNIYKVNLLFEKILLKIKGKLGCLCICLDNSYLYGNEFRQTFVKIGLKCGFQNVEIIDWKIAIYLNAMSQIKYKPKNDEIIWIEYNMYFHVWQIKDMKAEFIGAWKSTYYWKNMDDIVAETKLKKGPDVVVCTTIDSSSSCNFKIFNYIMDVNSKNEGALLKARLTASNQHVSYLNTFSFLSKNIVLQKDGKEIACFDSKKRLPVTHFQTLQRKTISDQLDVICDKIFKESFTLPNFEEIEMRFNIDSNGIYSLKFFELQTHHNQEKKSIAAHDVCKNNTLMQLPKKMLELSLTKSYIIPSFNTALNIDVNIIGIDLGTSRCCAAVNRKNGITTVPLDNKGERLLPSYVAYNEQNQTFGQVAVNRLRQFSKSTIFDSKRIIGKKFNDIEIDQNWNFTVYNENSQVYMEVNGFKGKQKITAKEVAADLLKHIKQKAEEFQGTKLFNVVVTVPAAFSEIQQTATKEAVKLAGWSNIKLLPESVAAAFAYFIDRPIPNNSSILLFDLGGGTLDVCIFKIENKQIKILSHTGDSKLGGRDFDTILINYFKNAISTDHGISNLKDKKYKLMLECQRIKEDLSAVISSSLDISEFDTNKDGIISISRDEFQRMSQTLLNKVRNTIQSALFKSRHNPEQINKVLLVGGGSRMPMIKHLLKEIFPQAEHCCEEHPDEVVAIGAAYYAYHIFSNQ